MNPLENRPFPIAFGGPGAVTVAGTRHGTPAGTGGGSAPRTRTITCQSSCSPDT